jgi:hypothetical protein
MSKGSISKKKNPTPEKGIRNNEKEEEEKTFFLKNTYILLCGTQISHSHPHNLQNATKLYNVK